MTGPKRKLIEVALPLEAINRESAREKSIRHGHPSTLHLWWARRPLAACRAVLFAQLVDDPSARPEEFPTEEAQAAERQRLFDLIERLVVWENTTDERLMRAAHREIERSADGPLPSVLDPFAGGGSIPLEAKRLGLEAHANDLNPLPVLLNTVLLELVDRFPLAAPTIGGMPGSPPMCVGADLRHWAEVLEERAAARVAHLYPSSSSGGDALVYFWARSVACPNPACQIEVPLVGSWRASSRKGSEAMFMPVPSADGRSIDVEIRTGRQTEPKGTIERTGGTCPACGTSFALDYVKEEGTAGRMGTRLLAVQERHTRARSFRAATQQDREAADVQSPPLHFLDAELSTHSQYMAPPRYGLTTFRDLFLPRQLVMLDAFVDELGRTAADAAAAAVNHLPEDNRRFVDGGRGSRAYGEAMRLLLALAIGRLLNRASSLCIWNAIAGKVEQTFARQAYSMTWFFAEANPFAGASGSFSGQVKYLAEAVEALPGGSGRVTWGPAQSLDLPTSFVVSTDPPYYDAVPYADLSDFFLVWLREMVGSTLPSTFNTVLAPKSEELVADHVRHGGRRQAADFFEDGLSKVFSRLADSHSKSYPMTVYYAFKAVETSTDGQDSTGWETFLQSLITAGWAIVGTWPLRTERSGGLRALGRNALASSVVVSCRLRAGTAEAISRRGLITALKQELPTALRELEQGSIAPVDLAQAAIGPGMAVFSRYARVVEADGSDMTVRTALALINQVLDEVLSEQEGDFDADTRFCLTWFSEYGWNEAEYGRADDLARSRNTSVDGLVRGGVFWARGGKARLVPPEDLGRVWNPSADERVSVWEAAVRLAQTLHSRGIEAAAEVMAGAGHRVDLDAVKELAYLLFAVSEKKNRTETALLFNQLASSWPDLSAAARSAGSASGGSAQGVLSFEGGE